jgi:fermentation-respiration switch protein FrsA (DUF1100 family)
LIRYSCRSRAISDASVVSVILITGAVMTSRAVSCVFLSAELGIRDYRGEGPFPTVVVLHGCIGITGHFTGIADRLSSWGYVALAVDSLGPRGISSRCGVGSLDQPFDAYAALCYLSQLDFVDPARVAVLSNSMGDIIADSRATSPGIRRPARRGARDRPATAGNYRYCAESQR